MRNIVTSDITLRIAAEEKKTSLSFREKLQIVKSMDASGIDRIELPPMDGSKADAVVYRTIADTAVNCAVAIDAGMTEEEIAAAWDVIRSAKKPVLQIVISASTVQMEYKYHVKAPQMTEKIAALVGAAAALCGNVELVIHDATRAEEGFAAKCAQTAAEAGAASVTLCDDSGAFFPEDYAALIASVKSSCALPVYVEPSDALNLAAACAVAAIRAGADGIKAACGAGKYLSIDVFADIYRAKGEAMDIACALDITAIHKTMAAIAEAEATDEETDIAENAEAALLNASNTCEEVTAAVKSLGYELSAEDNGRVYEEFCRVAEKKGSIGSRELEAIVASAAMQVPSTYHLVNYVVNSGNIITATANVTLERDGEKISGVSIGDGPIDAAFHAIEQIIGHHYELDDFQVHAITKGREAVGSSLIRLRANGKLYSGNGISTDIIGACIRAYMNALNKIIYEEN
ncbi:MAG: hypothetical protein E7604_09140 [Ruminococcaceae bacterium]|nr:hypothetical protein [Oscillospiraceae bacterium]